MARFSGIQSGSHPYMPTTPVFIEPSQDSFRRHRRRHRLSTVTRITTLMGGDLSRGPDATGTEVECHPHQEHQQDVEVTQLRQQGTALFGQIDINL